MGLLDSAIVIIVVFSGLLGLYWGFIRQALSLFGLLAGLALARAHTVEVADLLSSVLSNYALAQVIAFILIMLSVSAAASLLASLLRTFMGLLFLGWLDHAIGAILGIAQGALLCAAILLVAHAIPDASWQPVLQESTLAPLLMATVGSLIMPLLPGFIGVHATTTIYTLH